MSEKREREVFPFPRRGPGHFPMHIERPKDYGKTLRRLWQYLKNQRLRIALVILCVSISSLCFLLGPYLIGKVIDEAIIPRNLAALTQYIFILTLFYLATSLFSFLQERLAVLVAQHVALTLRNEAFSSLHALPLRFFDTHEHGDIMSRLTNDIDSISSTLATTVTQFFSGLVTLTGTVVFMFTLHQKLTLVALSAIPMTLLATRFVFRRTREAFLAQQTLLGQLNS
ncbi:MAG: ABC transporter ATP-binding protein, partial [Atribacterota bacterium]